MRVQAFAKLNLFLRILGRRGDGFHELETVFQSIDLADELSFGLAGDLRMTGGCDAAPPGPDNLVMRAAAALREAAGGAAGASIHLDKQIPVGAGLGGGSSDAAATLVALHRLWELNLSGERLAELAAALGSDVPFFLHGGTMLGGGRGEILEPIPQPSSLTFVLVRPSFPVATARAYAHYRPAPPGAPLLEAFRRAFATADPECLAPLLRNDLEAGVFGEWPELAALREELLAAGALGARMTGSGSVLFGLARDADHARQVAERLDRPGLWVRVARATASGMQEITEPWERGRPARIGGQDAPATGTPGVSDRPPHGESDG
jgi:4-diphosphocytidyl-2-C-methyl-D-erythritol kinase